MVETPFDPRGHVGKPVTFRGTALTAAAGAIVMSAGGLPVYLSGLERWPTEAEGRPVEVSGVIRLRRSEAPAPAPGELPVHDVGDSFVLDGPRWALAG